MICKMVEVRDRGTCIPMLAIKLMSDDPQEKWLIWRAGFEGSSDSILLANVMCSPHEIHNDPFKWRSRSDQRERTRFNAHMWIRDHFDEITPGQVVDVEFILGEVDSPKTSERLRQETLA